MSGMRREEEGGEGRQARLREEWEGRESRLWGASMVVDEEWSGKETLNSCIYTINWLSGRMGYLLGHHLPRRSL